MRKENAISDKLKLSELHKASQNTADDMSVESCGEKLISLPCYSPHPLTALIPPQPAKKSLE